MTSGGHALGTVCVIDHRPRELTPSARAALESLARQVVVLLEQRRSKRALEQMVSELRATDAELRRSEQLFREAFENATIGIALVSVNGEWLRVNAALCEIVGYTSGELVRTTFQAITHPEDLESDLQQVRAMLAGSIRTYEMVKRYIHKRGHAVVVRLSVSLVRDDRSTPLFFIAQIQELPF